MILLTIKGLDKSDLFLSYFYFDAYEVWSFENLGDIYFYSKVFISSNKEGWWKEW